MKRQNNFKSNFIHTLINITNFDFTQNINLFLPNAFFYSTEAAEHLIYLKAAGTIEAPHTFHYAQKNFHSYCIIYTQSGCGILQIKKENHSIPTGSLCFIDCRFEYSLRAASNWKYQIIFFDGYPVSYYYNLFHETSLPILALENNPSIPLLINKLIQQNYAEKELMNAKLLTDILTRLAITRHHSSLSAPSAPAYLVQIRELFDTNYNLTFSLDGLANEFQINKYRICKEFKKYFAVTPFQYLNTVRLEAAKILLRAGTLSVNEICYQVGFENPNYFIQLFKKDSGTTPAVYRKQTL